jgi:HAMP domain-containing protein
MEFLKNLRYSFLSIVLLILLPFMTVISMWMAISNYDNVYETILEGFNKKLLSISSVTASFIKGSDHAQIAIPKEIKASAYDDKEQVLYAIDFSNNLQVIHLDKGAAIKVDGFDLSSLNINDITINSQKNELYILNENDIVVMDLVHKTLKSLLSPSSELINHGSSGIAYDTKEDTLYLSFGKKLFKYRDENLTFVKEYASILSSLNVDNEILYGIDRLANKLFEIDLKTTLLESKTFSEFPIEGSHLHHLAVDNNHYYSGREHFMVFEKNSSTSSHENFARYYRDETSPIYLQYIKPMTDLKVALNLTYHYTFALLYGDDENNCYYIFDVNEGNEYTPIGSFDQMDTDDLLGAENVIFRDIPYVSEIKLWEKWGLLKVAYVGIKDKDGKVVAAAGTDVDITVIHAKTKEALIESIIIGIISLILGMVAAFYIAKKMIGPIQTLKYAALQIAAGKYGDKVTIKSPQELSELAEVFNFMSDELKNKVNSFNDYSHEVHSKRLGLQLDAKLHEFITISDSRITITGLESSKVALGAVLVGDMLYLVSQNETLDNPKMVLERSAMLNDLLSSFVNSGTSLDSFKELFNIGELQTINLTNSNQVIDFSSTKITIDGGVS